MKKIEAVIRPYRLEDVREALSEAGMNGLTVTEITGYGRQKGHTETYHGAEYSVDFLPKLKLELVLSDEKIERGIEIIQQTAKTGKIGDGKVFVTPLKRALRVRTGEEDEEAI